ncbi:CtsR family transcriptional regulator [Halocella sp. SP3-1]|nr:CtsR family transcriptional regulator [Halocella sp. SP3-1]
MVIIKVDYGLLVVAIYRKYSMILIGKVKKSQRQNPQEVAFLMANLSDQIERYLRNLIKKYQGEVEIKRNQLANEFNCAPSQINYVLQTRFPVERGYVVESQRGGGGYVRIIRLKMDSEKEQIKKIISRFGGPISQREAEAVIFRLFENEVISFREKILMETAVNKKLIGVNLPHRDYIRGRLFRGMLEVILKMESEEE